MVEENKITKFTKYQSDSKNTLLAHLREHHVRGFSPLNPTNDHFLSGSVINLGRVMLSTHNLAQKIVFEEESSMEFTWGIPVQNLPSTSVYNESLPIFLKLKELEEQNSQLNAKVEESIRLIQDFSEYYKSQTTKNDVETLKLHSLTLNSLNSKIVDFKKPVVITVEEHGNEDFIACLYEANVFGYGDTVGSAVIDLQFAIVNQYTFLLEQFKLYNFSDMLSKQFNYLKSNLKKLRLSANN